MKITGIKILIVFFFLTATCGFTKITTTQHNLFKGFSQYQFVTNEGIKINYLIGGTGKPLLLLHGYPETHMTWHKIAPGLAKHFTVIIPDLRGYGNSSKPIGTPNHSTYSKREMAKDQIELMEHLHYDQFFVVGHDRGARVAFRMAQDYPQKVTKLVLIDMLPTLFIFNHINRAVAEGYYHWFFFIQPNNFPEKMIGANCHYFIREELKRWSASGLTPFSPTVLNAYLKASCTPDAIHAAMEDYRAAASIDLVNDKVDMNKKIAMPLLVLWAKNGLMGKTFDVLKIWQNYATNVQGKAINSGHFIPEEAPKETYQILSNWLMR